MAERMAPVNPELAAELWLKQAKQEADKKNVEPPASVQEYEYRKQLPGGFGGEADKQFLEGKRQLQFLNTGQSWQGVGAAAAGQEVPIDPKISELPEFQGAQEAAKQQAQIEAIPDRAVAEAGAITTKAPAEAEAEKQKAASQKTGAALGTAQAELKERLAQLPRLEQVITELEELGKKATYTKAGQAKNIVMRELGLPVGEGAIARKEYISKVDNEILPLLRQTFGAQFTQKEGESLKATLGDPNASPEEKSAVLRSFIATKKAQIEGLQQQTSSPSADDDLINKYLK